MSRYTPYQLHCKKWQPNVLILFFISNIPFLTRMMQNLTKISPYNEDEKNIQKKKKKILSMVIYIYIYVGKIS